MAIIMIRYTNGATETFRHIKDYQIKNNYVFLTNNKNRVVAVINFVNVDRFILQVEGDKDA